MSNVDGAAISELCFELPVDVLCEVSSPQFLTSLSDESAAQLANHPEWLSAVRQLSNKAARSVFWPLYVRRYFPRVTLNSDCELLARTLHDIVRTTYVSVSGLCEGLPEHRLPMLSMKTTPETMFSGGLSYTCSLSGDVYTQFLIDLSVKSTGYSQSFVAGLTLCSTPDERMRGIKRYRFRDGFVCPLTGDDKIRLSFVRFYAQSDFDFDMCFDVTRLRLHLQWSALDSAQLYALQHVK